MFTRERERERERERGREGGRERETGTERDKQTDKQTAREVGWSFPSYQIDPLSSQVWKLCIIKMNNPCNQSQ